MCCVVWIQLGWDAMANAYEHGNEPSSSIKGVKFLDQLNNYQLLKKDSAAWS
jgi:hypothetical protein